MEDMCVVSNLKMRGQEVTDMWGHLSPASRRRYHNDWRYFLQFCERRGWSPAPAPSEALVEFINHLCGERHESFAGIRRKLSIIASVHSVNGLPDPRRNSEVLWLLCQVRRMPQEAKSKRPIFNEDIRKIVAHMGTTNRDIRDKSLLLIAYAASMSPVEVVKFRVEHIRQYESGFVLRIGESRPFFLEPEDDVTYCPVNALRNCCALVASYGGCVYHQIHGNRVQSEGLTERSVRSILRHRIAEIGLDPDAYSWSSLATGLFLEKIRGGWVPSPGAYTKMTRNLTDANESFGVES